MHSDLLRDALMVLGLAVAALAVFGRFSLPPIVAYLCIGLATGPHALGWVSSDSTTHLLGELGIALLLFTIGLEFSLAKFQAMRTTLLTLGGTQVLAGIITGGAIAWLLGLTWQGALVVGGALAMSSTAIVTKQLADQKQLQSTHGRLAVGILLFQDLAAVPLLVLIPLLAPGQEAMSGWPLLMALLKGTFVLCTILAVGHWMLTPLLREVAAARSSELFTLTALLVSLAAAWLTHALGLSFALGAFLAGMMLSETEFKHQLATDIRPFRDLFLGLFFILVGTQLDVLSLMDNWIWVSVLTAGLIVGKGSIIVLLTAHAGFQRDTAVQTGAVLAHGGEFGIALLALALLNALVTVEHHQIILGAIVLTMFCAPIIIRVNESFKTRQPPSPCAPQTNSETQNARHANLAGHVIICGYGRIGRTIASVLDDAHTDYVAFDTDASKISRSEDTGVRAFFGDTTHPDILKAAGIDTARALIITFDDLEASLELLRCVRRSNESLQILVRAADDSDLDKLYAAGASEVIPETLEAGLMLATQTLLLLNTPVQEVIEQMRNIKHARYSLLKRTH